jgi:hypothetical protein
MLKKQLDDQYLTSRAAGSALGRRLHAYFASNRAEEALHAAMDILTVSYFDQSRLKSDNLLEINAGPGHSGLSVEELRDPKKRRGAMWGKVDDCLNAVLGDELRLYHTEREKNHEEPMSAGSVGVDNVTGQMTPA